MKIIKHLMVIIIIALMAFAITKIPDQNNNLIFKIIIAVFLSMFLFSFLVRRIEMFKPFFTSKFNLITAKFRKRKEFEISKELLFHKFVEVVENSSFRLVETDEANSRIFAVSQVSGLSWGENIYIDFTVIDGKTILNFCSVTFFQIYSWGKNEQNYSNLLNEFDKSLII